MRVADQMADEIYGLHCDIGRLEHDNAKLLKLVRDLHAAYVVALNECEGLDEGLIWEYSGNVKADIAKSKAKFEASRHQFDAALRYFGIEVDE